MAPLVQSDMSVVYVLDPEVEEVGAVIFRYWVLIVFIPPQLIPVGIFDDIDPSPKAGLYYFVTTI